MLFEANIRDFISWLPWNQVIREKKAMRELLVQKRRIMTDEQNTAQSALIMQRLEQLPAFQQAKVVMLYYPIHHEANLLPLVKKYKHEKMLLFPVTHRHSMDACPYTDRHAFKRGKSHIPEPTSEPYNGPIDLIVVPGIAFDKKLNRLGRGGGYYDSFLHHHRHAYHVGVGFDFQLVDKVPVSSHDVNLNCVIVPSQTIEE